MTRQLNIIGLLLTTIGGALLIRFPPIHTMMTADGGGITSFHLDFASAVSLLIFLAGFLVQLVAIIRAR
jgi:hypothetical protein